ncbi:MAG: DinB family protein [Propionibacteriaceae bacterium]|nr:DinB family protein [Propionibacteriaceae bacterium]
MPPEPKELLQHYLQTARDAMLWKLDGLSAYDARRPLVPTGTNLLGLVKHLAGVEFGYFGEVFGRPVADPPDWLDAMDDEPNADLYATASESVESIVALYRRAWAHTDATVAELPLDAVGSVPWWHPDRREVSLEQILVHVIAETHRHAGHADLVRELVDGAVGWRAGNSNLPEGDADWWSAYRDRLEQLAREAVD